MGPYFNQRPIIQANIVTFRLGYGLTLLDEVLATEFPDRVVAKSPGGMGDAIGGLRAIPAVFSWPRLFPSTG